MPAYALDRNSSVSKMAAKEPFTIFGDIGELASNNDDPNASFFSRVSEINIYNIYTFYKGISVHSKQ